MDLLVVLTAAGSPISTHDTRKTLQSPASCDDIARKQDLAQDLEEAFREAATSPVAECS